MKKTILAILCLVFSLYFLTSCSKKDNSTPENQNKAITAKDLEPYYITSIRSNGTKKTLSVIYFTSADGQLNATWDKAGSRRVVPVTVTDNQFAFDEDKDGKYVYTFLLTRDNSGTLSIKEANYKDSTSLNASLDVAMINKVTDAPDFQSDNINPQIFTYTKSSDGDGVYVYFETESRWHIDDKHGSTPLYSYYAVAGGAGWKSEDPASKGQTIGVSVPDYNGNGPVMLIQSTADELESDHIHIAAKL